MDSLERNAQWVSLANVAKEAYQLNPLRVQSLAYAGKAFIEIDEYKLGAKILQKVVDAYPYQMKSLINLGMAYYMLENMEESLKIYKRVLSIDPTHPDAHYHVGDILMKKGKETKGLQHLRMAAEYSPHEALFKFKLGLAEYRVGNYELAAAAFKSTIQLKPDWELARKNLGIIYAFHANQPQKALKELKKTLEINPEVKDADKIRELIKEISP